MKSKLYVLLCLISFSLITGACEKKKAASMKLPDLKKELEQKAAASAEKTPEEIKKIMMSSIEELRKSDIKEKAFKENDQLPEIKLPGADGKIVDVTALNKKSPLIITFYRGSWCPYCNMQLRAYQQSLAAFKEAGAELVAISPDLPDESLSLKEKDNLDFYVLSDKDNGLAKKLGLVYKLPEELKQVYLKFGIDLNKSTGTASWELPLAATYVVDTQGVIRYAFLEEDYKKRAEPTDLVKILKEL